jgi:hypothetical protein
VTEANFSLPDAGMRVSTSPKPVEKTEKYKVLASWNPDSSRNKSLPLPICKN